MECIINVSGTNKLAIAERVGFVLVLLCLFIYLFIMLTGKHFFIPIFYLLMCK